jgi:hypothetical protein
MSILRTVRFPAFLRTPTVLVLATAIVHVTGETHSLRASFFYALVICTGGVCFAFAIGWWAGKIDFEPVGHGGMPTPAKPRPILQRMAIPLTLLGAYAGLLAFFDAYEPMDDEFIGTPAGALSLLALCAWTVCSGLLGRPRWLLPKAVREERKS